MAITPRLDLRQSQNLVMTPQLQQAIKLLQFSAVELAEFVEGELETNPMLERDEGQNDGPDPGTTLEASEAIFENKTLDDRADAADAAAADTIVGTGDQPLDADHSNNYDGDIAGPGAEPADAVGTLGSAPSGGGRGFEDLDGDIFDSVSEETTLRDHLEQQLTIDIANPRERMIGRYLIDLLDENGRLPADLSPVSEALGTSDADVQAVLKKVQRFDPPGLFARSLKECLALQLIDRDRYDPAMAALVENLELLAQREAPKLMKLCGIDAEDLTDMVAELRALDPKPALQFEDALASPVIPDVLLRANPDGEWIIELNPDALPRVLVNQRYHAVVSRKTRDKTEKDYISERFQTANWLVKSLHQRATTIVKVSTELVRQQDGFFRYGVSHLKPLILRDIADAIEMHESTVSRVTANKYMATPRGLFELKYFFTTAIASTDGEAHSAETVRHRIKTLIDEEPPAKILSDDKLVDLLRAEGIDIARRTVAKYREAMRIPSSVQRRREKRGMTAGI